MTLKPCPFCGAEDLKHYVTAASGGGSRGVVVCKSCGARLEAYKREYRSLLEAGYSWQDATAYERAHAFDAAAEKWNNRPELACALKCDMVNHCHVCDACGEVIGTSCYESVGSSSESVLKDLRYCPNCGRKIAWGASK